MSFSVYVYNGKVCDDPRCGHVDCTRVEPCYCEQAQEYEALLEAFIAQRDAFNDPDSEISKLIAEASRTVAAYKLAQKEYADE